MSRLENPQPAAGQAVEIEQQTLPNYVLTFKTANGEMMAWGIQTDIPGEGIADHIESAAREWLLSPDGRQFVQEEGIGEWGFDYANALQDVPGEFLARHGIQILVPDHETIELETGVNLLPVGLRE